MMEVFSSRTNATRAFAGSVHGPGEGLERHFLGAGTLAPT
jgi:hypothetical protein